MKKGATILIWIDFTNREPIYEQLQKKITQMALSGSLEAHEQLPSVRSLAKELKVNPNTIQKAYQFLEQDGVIYSIPGKGSFISPALYTSPRYKEEAKDHLQKAVIEAKSYGVSITEAKVIVDSVYKEDIHD